MTETITGEILWTSGRAALIHQDWQTVPAAVAEPWLVILDWQRWPDCETVARFADAGSAGDAVRVLGQLDTAECAAQGHSPVDHVK